jgi:hypothetical protein
MYADRVQETSSTAGTGTLTLAGATTGFRSFTSALAQNATVYYTLTDAAGDWEVGIGTFTNSGTTLSRDVILSSSNSGSAVSFSTTITVSLDFPAASIADKGVTIAFAMKMVPQ